MNYILGLLFAIHICYWIVFFFQLLKYKTSQNSNKCTSDIIICLKNEENNIPKLVKSIQNQSSKPIFVDDFSTDLTYQRLKKQNCTVFQPDIDRQGKKAALCKGIQMATADYVLFTDADCDIPQQWSQKMGRQSNDKDILLGYGPMQKIAGIIPLFSRYETYHTAIQYFSYALTRNAYMGVGRNMMVRRSAALKAVPHLLASELSSGDDDMMVNFLATKDNIAITLDEETFVYSEPKKTFKSFIRQKSRHISTSTTYKPLHQFLLGLYSASFMGFYTLLIIGLVGGLLSWQVFFYWLIAKWGIQSVVNWAWMKKLKESDLWWKFPLLDVMMYLYLVILSPYLVFKNKNHWN